MSLAATMPFLTHRHETVTSRRITSANHCGLRTTRFSRDQMIVSAALLVDVIELDVDDAMPDAAPGDDATSEASEGTRVREPKCTSTPTSHKNCVTDAIS
jgi:hypothetical protein